MKKFKIVFLAISNKQNTEINNIIKYLNFNFLVIEIYYIRSEILKKQSFFFNLLLNLILFIEKKFLNKIESVKNKKNLVIKKKSISSDSFVQLILTSNKRYYADIIIDLSNFRPPNKIIKYFKFGFLYIDYGVKNNFFIGFWECLLNYKIAISKLFLKKYENNHLSTSCIDIFYLNNKINFWQRNKEFIITKSSNLITKNLNTIYHDLNIKHVI